MSQVVSLFYMFIFLLGTAPEAHSFTPTRIQRDYIQNLSASAEAILPLLTPTGEKEWTKGHWNPTFIFHQTEPSEAGSIFVSSHESKETWIMTRYDPALFRVEYIRVDSSSHVCEIEIRLEHAGNGRSKAHLMYRYTGLTEEGNRFIQHHFSKENFQKMAAEWEAALNEYLNSHRRQ